MALVTIKELDWRFAGIFIATLGLHGKLRFRNFLAKSAVKLYVVIRMPSCVLNASVSVMRNVSSCQESASNII